MGAGASQLLADESANLATLSGDKALSFDSPVWQDLFRFKVPLDTYSSGAIASTFKDFCERIAPSTRNAEVESFAWPALVSSLLDFVSTSTLSDATYELHVQALTLLLAVLSSQLHHTDVLEARTVVASGADLAPGASSVAVASAIGGASPDPFLQAAMLVGAQPLGTGAGSSAATAAGPGATPSKRAAAAAAPKAPTTPTGETPQRAAAVVTSLLRLISVDGGRADDGPEPQGSDSNAPAAASLGLAEARTKAVAAWVAAQNRPVKTGGSLAGKVADGISNGVLGAVKGVAGLPGALISGLVMTDKSDPVPRPLAERAALALLLLAHNCRSGVAPEDLPRANPFRSALSTLSDPAPSPVPVPLPDAIAAVPPAGRVSLPFKPLFRALCRLAEGPLGVALVYTLLQGSPELASNLLVRSDCDELLLPVLSQLQRLASLGPDHRYILLVTLLLFSQDSAWCTNAHRRIVLPHSATGGWYTGRPLGSISLGSLVVLLLTRVVVSPSFTPAGAPAGPAATTLGGGAGSDSYLATNCFAALANMAPHVEGLHPQAAAKLVACLVTLHKRFRKASERLAAARAGGASESDSEVARLVAAVDNLDQCTRLCAEAVHACTAPGVLGSNAHLLYALMQHAGETGEGAARSSSGGAIAALASEPALSNCSAVSGLFELVSHFGGVLRAAEEAKLVDQMTPASASAAYTRVFSAPTPEEARQRLGRGEPASSGAGATASQLPEPAPAGAAAAAPAGAAPITPALYGTRPSTTIVWEPGEVLAVLQAALRLGVPQGQPGAAPASGPAVTLPPGVQPWRGGGGATAQAAALLETKFTYEEDGHPELFFTPYLWGTATAYTADVPWGCGAEPSLFPPTAAQIYVGIETTPATAGQAAAATAASTQPLVEVKV